MENNEQNVKQEEKLEVDIEPEKKKEDINDRHKVEDPYYPNGEEIDLEKEEEVFKGRVIMPTIDNTDSVKFKDEVNVDEFDKLTDKEKLVYFCHGTDINGVPGKYTNKDDMLSKEINEHPKNYVNDLNFSDTKLNQTVLSFKEPANKSLSGSNAIAIFRSMTASGNVIHVPLWHSGFWIVIKPPTQAEIVNLQLSLSGVEIQLGRDTNSLIYSNYMAMFTRVLSEFIVEHINSTSLKLEAGDDIRDYISIHDYFPILMGLLATMNPSGLDIVKACVNGAEVNEDGRPNCDFILKGKVDPKKLIWVDRSRLDRYMLSHMSNRTTGSMEKSAVKEYINHIPSLAEKEYQMEFSTGKKFSIVFANPTLKESATYGEEWVQEIISQAETTFSESDDARLKNVKVNMLATSIVLSVYNTYVKTIKIDDMEIKDRSTFNTILGDITFDNTAYDMFYDAIKDYVDSSPIALVATPSWECPKCKTKQERSTNKAFKEFIPINVLVHFFDHCDFRTTKQQLR